MTCMTYSFRNLVSREYETMTMSSVFVWLSASFVGAVVLIVVLFWIAGRYFKDDGP